MHPSRPCAPVWSIWLDHHDHDHGQDHDHDLVAFVVVVVAVLVVVAVVMVMVVAVVEPVLLEQVCLLQATQFRSWSWLCRGVTGTVLLILAFLEMPLAHVTKQILPNFGMNMTKKFLKH